MEEHKQSKEKIMPDDQNESCAICKKTRNTFLFLFAAAAAGAVVYFAIKEGQRIKAENELLDYEVW